MRKASQKAIIIGLKYLNKQEAPILSSQSNSETVNWVYPEFFIVADQVLRDNATIIMNIANNKKKKNKKR